MTQTHENILSALRKGPSTPKQLAAEVQRSLPWIRQVLHDLADEGLAHLADKPERSGRYGRREHVFALGPAPDGAPSRDSTRLVVIRETRDPRGVTARTVADRTGMPIETVRKAIVQLIKAKLVVKIGRLNDGRNGLPPAVFAPYGTPAWPEPEKPKRGRPRKPYEAPCIVSSHHCALRGYA
jgi:DNA-binding IclR family transcriptional regulator